ncbi:hypothetical protein GOP47_0020484 [Adiantum capillus-veneris]|uniref:t-SNARE coiled-coil homology domain-containing protein n=1 Tax=Adiantum capillus-veneris TaxID=13818 RepID=A0A9D4U971_ADICA|nr:hypothetical protein GOP47_0020484 [Adiantum capillus-veneris]
MSFQELVSRRDEQQQQQQDPRQSLAAVIFQINTAVSNFRRLVNSLGTPKDNAQLRLKLHNIRQHIGNLTEETSATLKAVCESDHANKVNRGRQIANAKLAKDFQAVIKEFQSVQRAAAQLETSYKPFVPQVVVSSSYGGGQRTLAEQSNEEEQALLVEHRRQELLAVDNERLFNEALIEERSQGIEAVQQQIVEVHEIFKDLSVLVHEQGVMIDDIEENIGSSHSAAVQANRQLSKAADSQKSSSSLVCLLLVIFGAALIIAIIVLAV